MTAAPAHCAGEVEPQGRGTQGIRNIQNLQKMKTIHQAWPYRPPGHGCGPPAGAGTHPGHSHGVTHRVRFPAVRPRCRTHFKQQETSHFPMKLQDPGGNADHRHAGGPLGDGELVGATGASCELVKDLDSISHTLFSAMSAGKTGCPAPGTKPENNGHRRWPQTKT